MNALRTWRGLAAGVVCVASSGCAGLARDFARDVTPGVIDGAVTAIANPEVQTKLAYGLEPAALREGSRRASAGVVDGVLDMLDEEPRKLRLQDLASDAREAVESTVHQIIDDALATALGDKSKARVRALVRELVTDVLDTGGTVVAGQLGTPEQRMATLGGGAREIMRQATLGFQDAVNGTREAKDRGELPGGRGSVLSAVWNVANSGSTIVWGLVGALGLTIVVVVTSVLLLGRKLSRHRAELEERDTALFQIAEAIKSTEEEPWAPQLQRALRERLRDQVAGDHLRAVLRKHSHLRLRPKLS